MRPAGFAKGGRDGAVSGVLALGFAALFLFLGSRVPSRAVLKDDVLFGADVARVVDDLTARGGDHYRTKVHPFFVLLLLPAGSLLRRVTASPYGAARVLTSLCGAAAVALLHRLLLRVPQLPRPAAVLLAVVFGMSFSTLIFAAVPETYIFAAISILPVYFLLLAAPSSPDPAAASSMSADRGRRPFAWGAAALSSFAITSTNVVQALWGLLLDARYRRLPTPPSVPRRRQLATAVLAAAAVAVSLTLIQARLYPSAQPFWNLEEERGYTATSNLLQPAAYARAGRAVFLDAIVAPTHEVVDRKVVTAGGVPAAPWGPAAAGLWGVWMVVAAVGSARRYREHAPAVLAIAGSLGFNLLLHVVYGNEQPFLYSAHWTFLLVLGVALGYPTRRPRLALAGLGTLAAVLAAHNFAALARIAASLRPLSLRG